MEALAHWVTSQTRQQHHRRDQTFQQTNKMMMHRAKQQSQQSICSNGHHICSSQRVSHRNIGLNSCSDAASPIRSKDTWSCFTCHGIPLEQESSLVKSMMSHGGSIFIRSNGLVLCCDLSRAMAQESQELTKHPITQYIRTRTLKPACQARFTTTFKEKRENYDFSSNRRMECRWVKSLWTQ